MNNSVFIFAKITPRAEHYDKAKAAIKKIIPNTREEPGCLGFILHEDRSGNLYLYEEWGDESALQHHYDMEYTKEVFTAYKDWLDVPPEITRMKKLA